MIWDSKQYDAQYANHIVLTDASGKTVKVSTGYTDLGFAKDAIKKAKYLATQGVLDHTRRVCVVGGSFGWLAKAISKEVDSYTIDNSPWVASAKGIGLQEYMLGLMQSQGFSTKDSLHMAMNLPDYPLGWGDILNADATSLPDVVHAMASRGVPDLVVFDECTPCGGLKEWITIQDHLQSIGVPCVYFVREDYSKDFYPEWSLVSHKRVLHGLTVDAMTGRNL
jgi:hypothetical protein